jgi:hypothetical protein
VRVADIRGKEFQETACGALSGGGDQRRGVSGGCGLMVRVLASSMMGSRAVIGAGIGCCRAERRRVVVGAVVVGGEGVAIRVGWAAFDRPLMGAGIEGSVHEWKMAGLSGHRANFGAGCLQARLHRLTQRTGIKVRADRRS